MLIYFGIYSVYLWHGMKKHNIKENLIFNLIIDFIKCQCGMQNNIN